MVLVTVHLVRRRNQVWQCMLTDDPGAPCLRELLVLTMRKKRLIVYSPVDISTRLVEILIKSSVGLCMPILMHDFEGAVRTMAIGAKENRLSKNISTQRGIYRV